MLAASEIRALLLSAGPDALRAWSADNWLLIEGAIDRARVEAEGGADEWSLDEAIAWMQEAAEALVGQTVFEDGKMVKDDTGASGSTFAPLTNYAAMGADAPLNVHADALELLRVHSHQQLDRRAFERAYAAVERAMHDAGMKMPREGVRTYVFDPNKATALKGGGRYRLDRENKQIVVDVGYNANLVKDMRAGALNGIARYRDAKNKDYTLIIDPSRTADFARVVRKHGFSELAAAVDQLGGYWRKSLGIREPGSANTAEAGAVPADATRWRWDPDAFRVRVYVPRKTVDVAREAGSTVSIGSDPEAPYAERYFVALPTRPELMAKALDALARVYPATVEAMRPFAPTWTAARSALKQSREAGRTEEGEWQLFRREKKTTKGIVATEFLRVYPSIYLRDPYYGDELRWWSTVPSADARKHDGRRRSVEINVKYVGKLVDAMREHFPRLAEAISRSFGGVAGVVDEEAERCAPLIDLHDKLAPEQVTNEDAIGAIDYVQRAFRARVPAGLSPLPFQTVGIAFAKLTNYRALIGDAPGLGKTIQGLGCLITDPEMLLPAVIVAPKNVTVNWVKEAKKWMPTVPVRLIETGEDEIPAGWKGISVMGWEMMVAHAAEIIEAGTACVIADEAHYAKKPTTQRTKSLVAILEKVPHALLLTGTPIKNVVVELHTLLAALDKETWSTRKAFAAQYV